MTQFLNRTITIFVQSFMETLDNLRCSHRSCSLIVINRNSWKMEKTEGSMRCDFSIRSAARFITSDEKQVFGRFLLRQ